MAKAICVLRVSGKEIDRNNFSCSGEQMVLLLQGLENQTLDCVWYAADVDAHYPLPPQLSRTHIPQPIGRTIELLVLVKDVPQFLGGVFLAIPDDLSPPTWSRAFYTDDDPFEEMDGSRYEIRAFDTTFFEVCAEEPILLQELAGRFNVHIECTDG